MNLRSRLSGATSGSKSNSRCPYLVESLFVVSDALVVAAVGVGVVVVGVGRVDPQPDGKREEQQLKHKATTGQGDDYETDLCTYYRSLWVN